MNYKKTGTGIDWTGFDNIDWEKHLTALREIKSFPAWDAFRHSTGSAKT